MATNTKQTVSQILTIIADLRGETTTDTSAKRIRAISRANQDFATRKYWPTHRLIEQFQVGDGSSSYAISVSGYPAREKGLTEVYVDGTTSSHRYQIVDYSRFRAEKSMNDAAKIAFEWYDAANDEWKMRINATLTASNTIYHTFYWEPEEVTETTDTVVCSNPDIIAYLALARLYESEEEQQMAIAAKRFAEGLIDELEGINEMPAENQTYSLGAVENSVGSNGIGTY